jgi:hypothetical protein
MLKNSCLGSDRIDDRSVLFQKDRDRIDPYKLRIVTALALTDRKKFFWAIRSGYYVQ